MNFPPMANVEMTSRLTAGAWNAARLRTAGVCPPTRLRKIGIWPGGSMITRSVMSTVVYSVTSKPTGRVCPVGVWVGEGGLEPPRPEGHWHLKPARLPFRHSPVTSPDEVRTGMSVWETNVDDDNTQGRSGINRAGSVGSRPGRESV